MQKFVAALAFMLLLAGGDARAQVDAAKLEAAKTAAAKFKTLAAGSEKSGKPPRASDPAVQPLLAAIYDVRDIQAAKTIPVSALGPLSQRMTVGTDIAVVYMLAGTGFASLDAATKDPAINDKINVNTVEFAPEFGSYFDFQLKIQGAVIDAVLTKMGSSRPDELKRIEKGIADIRSGSQRVVAGLLETLALNGLTDEWLRARTPVLLEVTPKLARFLLPEQKAQLRELALQVIAVTSEPQVKKQLEEFAARIAA